MFGASLIDTNKTPPTLVMLPFCLQLYPNTCFSTYNSPSRKSNKLTITGSRRNSTAKVPLQPSPKPPTANSPNNTSKRPSTPLSHPPRPILQICINLHQISQDPREDAKG